MPDTSDPLATLMNALTEAATDYAAAAEDNHQADMAKESEHLRALIAGIAREDLPEVLFRMTTALGTAALIAYSE
jgi:hypothetical protein